MEIFYVIFIGGVMRAIYGMLLLPVCIFSQLALAAMEPDEALDELMKGNERYVAGKPLHPNHDEEARQNTAEQQAPFAVVLGCSDSRVPPEIIFDQGIGDLFIVRVAGNVAGPIELDSIEFSALTFGSAAIVVLGHKNCGAVKAVVSGDTKDIESVATLIEPAVQQSKDLLGNRLDNAVEMNIRHVVQQLEKTAVLSKLIQDKKLKIVGGCYDLQTGKIEFLK